MNKRFLSIILVLSLMMFLMIPGCIPSPTGPGTTTSSGVESSVQTSSSEQVDSGYKGELPLVREPLALTIGITQKPSVTDYDSNYTTKYIEKNTGIDLSFYLFPANEGEARQKLELMVASNQELPDIVMGITLSDVALMNYGEQGVILPLNDYLEKDAYYWNITVDKWCSEQEKENLFKFGTMPDGKVYGFPVYYGDPGDPAALGLWINKTWLSDLGLEFPTTTDELYEVLKAFRDNDPNKNGKQDEIPLIGHTGWKGSVSQAIINSFIYFSDYYFNAENGVISTPFTDDAFRDALRYLNKLAEGNILSPLSFSQKQAELKAIMENNDNVGVFCAHPGTVFNQSSARRMNFTGMPPMKGPNGVAYTPHDVPMSKYHIFITNSCKNPDIAFRLLDFMSKEETGMIMRFGEQGFDWEYTNEGESRYSAISGYTANWKWLNDFSSAEVNTKNWHYWTLCMVPPKLFGGVVKDESVTDEYYSYFLNNWYESIGLRQGKHPDELVSRLIFTEDELNEINDIQNSVKNYVKTSITRFILGDMDIESDWSRYLSELDKMGLKKYVEVVQTSYTRMNKK